MRHGEVDARVVAWTEAYRLGVASAACDRIVRTRPVPDRLLAALLNPKYVALEERPHRGLTAREKEILRCFGCGLTHRAVAALLGISQSTIQTHKRRIRMKLGARNTAHAYAIAYRNGEI